MSSPLHWEDPPWGEYDDPWDWRWFIAPHLQVEWLNLSDDQRWEIALAAHRLSQLQRSVVASLYQGDDGGARP